MGCIFLNFDLDLNGKYIVYYKKLENIAIRISSYR